MNVLMRFNSEPLYIKKSKAALVLHTV